MIKLKKRLKKLWVLFAVFVIVGGFFVAISFSDFLANISLTSTNMLQSAIQAETTMLGFFAIIGAYFLTSCDTRIDRLEQQLFDLKIAKETFMPESITNRISDLKENKSSSAVLIAIIASVLIVSLLCSITALGMKDANSSLAKNTSSFGFYTFFIGIGGIVYFFYMLSRDK
jgi:drug/metabolite transporter (DMT)-like permease